MYKLKEELREKLKEPLDVLLEGGESEIIEKIKKEVVGAKNLISVGDHVSKSLYENKIKVGVYILDNKIKRMKIEPLQIETKHTFHLKNEPGTINPSAFELIKKAIELGDSKIIVDGEEDLLVLPAISVAPENSKVLYGQPDKGVVVVNVNKQKKEEIEKILEEMRPTY
ncbi:MAG: DUF359 domain-containing protein [Candidatus Parvarchaeota archaeon]|nr:DUF359 domain-containing protein [Candidatus Jingweiarchaeum tengchongense]MCW1297883.1 DUF359 domain-containing protein [Candidatus Jingweiarchaeum tengchongense]MCW1299894.1 DUF359 domain-containing protein [Candidatus Jingweiarchaeum tengchongense]MCW1305102.1 DUF359 domain-containing protein [Candidatus Jingweiarchaeum tengchongense]MCW1305164.1 DUF359 domain-containing protein [Candidatus Jingweiarchaeum tengchongense]